MWDKPIPKHKDNNLSNLVFQTNIYWNYCFSSLNRPGHWSSERLGNLFKVTQQWNWDFNTESSCRISALQSVSANCSVLFWFQWYRGHILLGESRKSSWKSEEWIGPQEMGCIYFSLQLCWDVIDIQDCPV